MRHPFFAFSSSSFCRELSPFDLYGVLNGMWHGNSLAYVSPLFTLLLTFFWIMVLGNYYFTTGSYFLISLSSSALTGKVDCGPIQPSFNDFLCALFQNISTSEYRSYCPHIASHIPLRDFLWFLGAVAWKSGEWRILMLVLNGASSSSFFTDSLVFVFLFSMKII